MELPWAEPYKIKMTEEIRLSSREETQKMDRRSRL